MTKWFTSDTHFGHARIIELCDRPFSDVQEMNEILILRWNSVVDHDDIVYHLGDVALGPWDQWEKIIPRLNGRKRLIIGNHDRVFAGQSEAHRNRFMPIYGQWFASMAASHDLFLGDHHVTLSHFPYDGDSHGEERYRDHRPVDMGVPLIHGHTHGRDQKDTLSNKGTPMYHVGVDAHGFVPVPEDTIVTWLDRVG